MIRREQNFRVRKYRFIFILIFLYPSLILSADEGNKVLASVGTHKIYLNDFSERYTGYISSSGIKDNLLARLNILNNMVSEILLKDYDDNGNVYNNPEYHKELNWTRNQTILDYLKDQEIYGKLTVTEEEISEAFLRSNKQIAARHLYTQTEEEANYLYELLKIGVDFDNLAAQVFTDSTLRNNGGFLGYFTWGDLDPAFEEAAFSLKVGETSAPVKTVHGYSIIRVDDIIKNPIITEYQFQQRKSQIEHAVRINKKEPAERDYISNLVNINEINFNEEILQVILNGLTGLHSDEKSLPPADDKCVEYKGNIYKYSYVEHNINELTEDFLQILTSIDNLKAVIKGFIIRDELLKVAYQKGYDKNERVEEAIGKIHNNLFFRYKKKEIFEKAIVPDEEVLDFYYHNIHMFTKESEINVQEIIVEDKLLADSLLLELNSGKSFEELAKIFSIREWSARHGGEMGYAPLSKYGMMRERFWNEPVGTLIGPVEIEGFYGIFRVLGKINGQPIDFNIVKSEAAKLLKEERGKEIMTNYIDEIKNKVKVEIDRDLLWNHVMVYSSESNIYLVK